MVSTLDSDLLRVAATSPLVAGDLGSLASGRHSGFIDGVETPYASGDSVALWTSAVRYFAVDADGGNDLNLGYSDVSMAAAGAAALATIGRLLQIFPKSGDGRIAVIAVKVKVNGLPYGDDLSLVGVHGYKQLVIRGTGTVATAGATAFLNDAVDRMCCGGRIFPTTNSPGYNPTGVPTVNTFTCQLNGGGAPSLSIGIPVLAGKRIRFNSATATTALRNAVTAIWSNTASSITTATDLPVAPSTSDVFYIEEPGVSISRVRIHASNETNSSPLLSRTGIQVAGIRVVGASDTVLAIQGPAALVNCSFVDVVASISAFAVACSGGTDLSFTDTYTDESTPEPLVTSTGVGVRAQGGISVSNQMSLKMRSSVSALNRFQVTNVSRFNVGEGCVSKNGFFARGCGSASPSGGIEGAVVGNGAVSSARRLRIDTDGSGSATSIEISTSHLKLRGVDATNLHNLPIIAVDGVGCSLAIDDVVGSLNNTGLGLDLSAALDCRIVMGALAANTFTGTAGRDIAGAGPVYYVHADYARTDLRDENGNHIQGSARSIVGSTVAVTNDNNENIGQYKAVRATGSGAVRAAKADTVANSSGVVGVSQGVFNTGSERAMAVNSGATWIQFDAAPTAGNTAYLSTATAGNAMDTVPAAAGTNTKLRLGRILRVSGTLGLVMWEPETFPVPADGVAAVITRRGSVSFGAGVVSVAVVFPSAYAVAPNVASSLDRAGANIQGWSTDSITTAGFTFARSAAAGTATGHWIAMGS